MKKLILKGVSVSSGVIKAKIYKIHNTAKPAKPKPGYIIVADYTTPVIAPALMQAGEIICSTGGLTSHAAIIAREFNIPCIVGVKSVMKRLNNNQEILLDSNKGKIYET